MTTQDGDVEFLLFFMSGSLVGSGDCLESLHTVLTWPQAWSLAKFEPCYPLGGSLDPGGTTHVLDLGWGYPYPVGEGYGAVIPVARLVMNVVGPGRLDFASGGEAVILNNCSGSTFVTHPIQIYAEAGMACDYLAASCNFRGGYCKPVFHDPELVLKAPTGGASDSTVLFHSDLLFCGFAVDTNAPWCAASVEVEQDGHNYRLHVTADATGLPPKTYETAIELSNDFMGTGGCLPVRFHVEAPTATATATWGRVKALYR
jgi:hypothetical protein